MSNLNRYWPWLRSGTNKPTKYQYEKNVWDPSFHSILSIRDFSFTTFTKHPLPLPCQALQDAESSNGGDDGDHLEDEEGGDEEESDHRDDETLVLGEITPKSPLIEAPEPDAESADSTDNESRSPWEHTGEVAKYHEERRLARIRGEEWPPRIDYMPPSSDDEDSESEYDYSEYPGIGIGDDIPNLPASVNGDTDAGFNLHALAVGPMPPTPPSEEEEGGMSKEPMSKEPEMPKVSHYVTPPKRPGVSKEPHSGIKKVKNEPGESKVTEDTWLGTYICVLLAEWGGGLKLQRK